MFNEICSLHAVDELNESCHDVEHLIQDVDGTVSELSRDEIVDLIIRLRDICCTQQYEINRLAEYIEDISGYVNELQRKVDNLESFNSNFVQASMGS